MLYKPSFCCHCGEKIDKADWKLFSSRRFCDVCKEENKGFEMLAKLAVIAAFLLPLSVVGSFLRTGDVQPAQANKAPLARVNKTLSAAEGNREKQSPSRNLETLDEKGVAGSSPNLESAAAEIGKQPRNPKITSEGEVFYCGALTKKGTACTRKVKTKGNCWQHSVRTVAIPAGNPASGN